MKMHPVLLQPSLRYISLLLLAVIPVVLLMSSCSGGLTSPDDGNRNSQPFNNVSSEIAWRQLESGTDATLWGVWGSLTNAVTVGDLSTIAQEQASQWPRAQVGDIGDFCSVWIASDANLLATTAPATNAGNARRGFAVGLRGLILGYDGVNWTPMTSGTDQDLFSVWGFDAGPAFVVGLGGNIQQFDGITWSAMQSITDVSLFGLWGSASSSLYAVGVGGTIVHYDGTEWSFMESPATANLSSVWGTSDKNIWAVGDNGTVLHYDGVEWSDVSLGETGNLFGIWGSSGEDVWVVGKFGTILHYDGEAWSSFVSPTENDLFSVWGRAKDDVFAVGKHGTILRYSEDSDEPGDDTTRRFVLHDHPKGSAAPPTYGLRLDDLISSKEGQYTFSFDYSDKSETARVVLDYDEDTGEIHISGRAFGGLAKNGDWAESNRGWITIDFTYTRNVSIQDDCAGAEGDDFYVSGQTVNNTGTFTLDGWGDDAVFTYTDKQDNNGCSFIFDNDRDSKGVAVIANDPDMWSGSGWLRPDKRGYHDWVFVGEEEITEP